MAVMTVYRSGQPRLLTRGRNICHKRLVILGQLPKSCTRPLLFPGVSSVVLPSSIATADVQKLSKWATLVPSHLCRFIQHALIGRSKIKSREPSLGGFHAPMLLQPYQQFARAQMASTLGPTPLSFISVFAAAPTDRQPAPRHLA
jgi:hypothetical protein